MPTLPKPKLILTLLVVAIAMALPAAANATLTYTKGFGKSKVYVAEDNGKGARAIGQGRNSHISPNGEWVVYERGEPGGPDEMRLYSVSARKSERLLNPWRETFYFAWSPDSTKVAAITGGLNGPGTLVVIDVKTGARTKVASGYINGVSFSPTSEELVYGNSRTLNFPLKSDVFRYDLATAKSVSLTHDHNASDPLWGPTGQIVFVRELGAKQRRYVPKNELYVMNEEGQRISRLTHTVVDPLAQGLAPVAWSEDGTRLLTEFGGQDQSYAVAVNTVTGAQKALTKQTESGLQAAALSADGKTVLGTVGYGFGEPHPKVVTVPFSGGPQKVLVVGGYAPSWSE